MNRMDPHNKLLRVLLVLAGLVYLSTSASGIPLDAYKAKIGKARSLAIDVENALLKSEPDHAQARELSEHIRANFQASERVEWPGGEVDSSNEWLLAKNSAFDKETALKKRLSIIVEMREYLSAIAFKIRELESTSSSARTKDEDKQKLAEILRREEYQKLQAKEESALQRWFRQFMEWLESLFQPTKQTGNVSGFGGLGLLLQALLFVGLFALLVFLVYKILPLIVPNVRRPRKQKKKDRVILGEKIAEDDTAVDLLAEAERLAREGNLRAAIRKGYIALLCELGDRKVLGLARHKTNRDYLRDVRNRQDLHPRMKAVTDAFERHWYGFQESDAHDWDRFRDEYDRAIRSV